MKFTEEQARKAAASQKLNFVSFCLALISLYEGQELPMWLEVFKARLEQRRSRPMNSNLGESMNSGSVRKILAEEGLTKTSAPDYEAWKLKDWEFNKHLSAAGFSLQKAKNELVKAKMEAMRLDVQPWAMKELSELIRFLEDHAEPDDIAGMSSNIFENLKP